MDESYNHVDGECTHRNPERGPVAGSWGRRTSRTPPEEKRGRETLMHWSSLRDGVGPASSPGICHRGHIFWASGWRPGYPPAFLALCTHDLILALQPPTGQEAVPYAADGDAIPRLGWPCSLGWGSTVVGPRHQQNRSDVLGGVTPHLPGPTASRYP
jgi:hypothetical protein